MKTTETTICPICQQKVSVNPRTFTIRKHRLAGHGSDVCDGSGRLFLRPHNLASTTNYTLYVNSRPLISTSDRQYLTDIEAGLEVEYDIQVEPLASVADIFDLPRATPERLNLHWCYLPWWITSSYQGPLVRSKTCNNLVGIPSGSTSSQALVLRATLEKFLGAVTSDAFIEQEINEALEQLKNGSSPHAPLVVSPRIAAQIINTSNTYNTKQAHSLRQTLMIERFWIILSHNVISADISARGATLLINVLDNVENALARNSKHRAHLREDLIQISHIRDILNVHSMFSS